MYGEDKFENEDMIKYHTPNQIWFHVDSHSSAHIYLCMSEEMTFDTLPEDIINECAQLTKYNSIEGCKLNNITICYTPADNLLKTGSMEIGAVSFKNMKQVKRCFVKEKDHEFTRYFKKNAQMFKDYNYPKEQQSYFQAQQKKIKKAQREEALQKKQFAQMAAERKQEQEKNSIKHIFDGYDPNQNADQNVENNDPVDLDDFM